MSTRLSHDQTNQVFARYTPPSTMLFSALGSQAILCQTPILILLKKLGRNVP